MAKHTKQQLKELINDAIDDNDQVGEEIVCMVDVWRDSINVELNKMNLTELNEVYDQRSAR